MRRTPLLAALAAVVAIIALVAGAASALPRRRAEGTSSVAALEAQSEVARVLVAAPTTTTTAAAPAADAEAACTAGPDLDAVVAAAVPGGADDVGVWVVDLDDGCSWGVGAETSFMAASTIKLLVLAGVLELAQSQGRLPDAYERSLLEPMIGLSDNDATTELIGHLEAAGVDVAQLGDRWGVPGAQASPWGLSEVTARQMADLVGALFDDARLGAAYQDLAHDLLDLPEDDFESGWRVAVGYGLPDGWWDGSKVGLLDWDGALNVHGVGLVEGPDGHRWAVAVLAAGWDGYDDSEQAYAELNALGATLSCLIVGGGACAAA